ALGKVLDQEWDLVQVQVTALGKVLDQEWDLVQVQVT
mgnify:CR=1